MKFIIIGAGHFGIRAVQTIEKAVPDAEVTVLELGKKDYIDMNVQTPRCMVDKDFADKVYIPLEKAWKRASLVHIEKIIEVKSGSVKCILAGSSNIKVFNADGIIVATGASTTSSITKDTAGKSKNERINQLKEWNDSVAWVDSILIVGGGATGVEVAGEIIEYYPRKSVTILNKAEYLLKGNNSPKKIHKLALRQLEKSGIRVINNDYIEGLREDYIGNEKTFTTKKGNTIKASLVIVCVGSSPRTEFVPKECKEEKCGGIIVDKALVSRLGSDTHHPVWAIGDCTKYGGRSAFADSQIAALEASIKHFRKHGTVEGGPAKYNHKPSESYPYMVSIGKNGGVMSLPWPNKFLAKALKCGDLGLKFFYNKEFQIKI